jgi:hypothetical protein
MPGHRADPDAELLVAVRRCLDAPDQGQRLGPLDGLRARPRPRPVRHLEGPDLPAGGPGGVGPGGSWR